MFFYLKDIPLSNSSSLGVAERLPWATKVGRVAKTVLANCIKIKYLELTTVSITYLNYILFRYSIYNTFIKWTI